MFTIYDDETTLMAIKRFETLLERENKKPNPFAQANSPPADALAALTQTILLKEIAPEFVESETRKLVCRREGKLEYAQLDGQTLGYFVGDTRNWGLVLARPSQFHVVNGEICVHNDYGKHKHALRVTSSMTVQCPVYCTQPMSFTYAVDYDTEGSGDRAAEAACRTLNEGREARYAAVELERKATVDRYQLAIEYLRLRQESQLPLRPLRTVPRPVSDSRRNLLSCKVNMTASDPNIPNYTVRLFPGMLVVTSATKTVAVKDPQAWTINSDWLSVQTGAGWVGFALLTGEPAEPIPFQYDWNFELTNVSKPVWW